MIITAPRAMAGLSLVGSSPKAERQIGAIERGEQQLSNYQLLLKLIPYWRGHAEPREVDVGSVTNKMLAANDEWHELAMLLEQSDPLDWASRQAILDEQTFVLARFRRYRQLRNFLLAGGSWTSWPLPSRDEIKLKIDLLEETLRYTRRNLGYPAA